jgi:acetyl-CoA synthetase
MIVPTVPIPAGLQGRAHVRSLDEYRHRYEESVRDPAAFWDREASLLTFFHPYHTVHEAEFGRGEFGWFLGGKLNAAFNCVDRHLERRADQPAILWVGDEPGQYETITYRQLHAGVARIANVLLAHGVRRGDRVCLYLPMIKELAFSMLACARIGAMHSVVFAGFSAESLRDRILDADCRLVITANEGCRGGKRIALKGTVDRAVAGTAVERVLVVRRTDTEVPMQAGRDLWLADEEARQRAFAPIEWMDAESPLFVLYTSGSTGKPKGVLHTTAGYLLYAASTHRNVFDWHDGDVHFCAADIGWITGHSYIVYGPLCNGATTVMFESTPVYPDAGRYWQVVDDLRATIFYTAPTALRAIAKAGDQFVRRHRRDSLRVLGSVGEPINPEIWQWYHDVVGERRCAVVDTWWQTETGGILITPLPGAIAPKPGAATLPYFGVQPVVVDDSGRELTGGEVRGNLCLRASWPGQARTVWGDHARFQRTYFAQFPGLYFTGDGCRRDADGYYWITGRVDDVLNVAGHRLGTAEIESALVGHEAVAEAAVVGFPHEVKGTGIHAYVMLRPGWRVDDEKQIVGVLRDQVRHAIGAFAMPDRVQIVAGLPKTRSGKIMRRILRKIAEGDAEDLGDLTTLADPGVVEQILAGRSRPK